ncbi:MAG: MBOAT family O-acyltransferase [Myxococcota bacterium]|nr:MBOAT family O-acyltransferase [Myxococcota bacterium]
MLFNSLQYAIFLLAIWLVTSTLPRSARVGVLLAASFLFYALWHPIYLLLLATMLLVNFALLRVIANGRHVKWALAGSISFTLASLIWFKYAALLITTAAPAIEAVFGAPPAIPTIFLPLGISFYSFQIIALAVDVKRGEVDCPPSLSRYALFVCFFPQLVAGPILRGSELLPQLEGGGEQTPERTRRGLWLLAVGAMKKMLFADFLLAGFVNTAFGAADLASAPIHLFAVYSFAFQIYFDFSGYTDMARGSALLLGIELPLNFREPYLSRNPAEFWRRWHITLSSWLRDYLYIPLGGNRYGNLFTRRNLALTMMLGGLWHGAAWTFLLWGTLHGAFLIAHRLSTSGGRGSADEERIALRDLPAIVLCFHAVCIGWVFFRAPDVATAMTVLGTIATGSYASPWPWLQVVVVSACAALHVAERIGRVHVAELQAACGSTRWGPAVEGLALGAALALAVAVSDSGGDFIYFQF